MQHEGACSAYAWGWVEDGRNGVGEEVARREKQGMLPRPVWALGRDKAVRASKCAAGHRHSVFLLLGGQVRTCGSGADGALGALFGAAPEADAVLPPLPPASRDAPPPVDRAALRHARAQKCAYEPVTVDGFSGKDAVVDVFAGDATTFALTASGVLYSWGRGAFGALGHDDGERDHFTPAKLSTLRFASHPVRRVACGASHCVVACTTNVLFGWGRNDAGQVGVGDASRAVLKPEVIVLSQGDSKQPVVRDVSAGAAHTVCVCVVRLGGQDDVIVYAWGDPANRRLGGVDEKKHASPQRLALLAKFMTRMRLKIATAPDRGERCIVSCGGAHTLLLTSICTLVAWGAGSYGQLGYGDVWDHDTPIIIPRVRAVIAFSAGARHSIAVEGVSDRKGPNEFEAAAKLLNLGDVFKPKPPKPKADDADEEAKPGKLWAWGFNSFGELGVGDVDVRLQPCAVRALDAATVKACAAGAQHSLALTTGDAVAFKDDARYQPSLAVLKERGGYRHLAKLKAKLEEDHLDSAGLDEPDAMVPGQPGVANVPARPSPPFEPALRYCLDTVPLANPRDKSRDIARRSSYEAVVRCLPCGLRLVCRACARRCHGGHAVEPSFVRWVPVEMVCGCLASGKCRVKWSKERAVFDGLVEATQKERISETDTRAPADEVLEDDFDSGEVGLHTAAGTTSWAAFEKWHTPYFEEKDREVEQLADFETEAAAAAAAGGRSPAPRRDNAAR